MYDLSINQRGVLMTSDWDYYVINPLYTGRVRRGAKSSQPHVIIR